VLVIFLGWFDAGLFQQSAVGAVMARETASSRYAKWLRLLRRRIECKGVRVGRIHKLWPAYVVIVCCGCGWATSGDAVRSMWWCLEWCVALQAIFECGGGGFAGRRGDVYESQGW
jgi:hypothetical protein